MSSPTEIQDADELFKERYAAECRWIHRFMKSIMIAQWILGITFAMYLSPFTWIGQQYAIHVHVWAAIFIGGSLSGFAIAWMKLFPNLSSTRHVVAICQVLWSALLIHLSGGRIETHFHVFASLAILSIYRDWKILISAAVVVAVDHFIRGVFYPASVFGVFTESPYRWMEHAAWVIFEISVLVPGCYLLRNEFRELCVQQSELKKAKSNVDRQVEERTRDLRAANEKLKVATAEAEKLALVAKYTENAVVIMNRKAEIEWVNEGYTRITQYTLADVIGKQQLFLHGEETCPIEVQYMRSQIANGKGFDVEIVNYRKDGERFWLSMEVRPITNSLGEVVRFIAIQSDVTPRKQMELSLADAEQRLRSIVNNVPGASYRTVISEDLEQKTEFVSDFIEKLTGQRAQDFLNVKGIPHLKFVHPDDLDELKRKMERSIAELCAFEHEYRIVALDQTVRWVSEKAQCNAVETDGARLITVDGILFDITARIDAETENQKLQAELIDASRQAGMAEIATGVLHNVGNILNSVNVSASMIRRQFDNSALSRLQRFSDLIRAHESNFGDFVCNDERGRKTPAYLQKVTRTLVSESEQIDRELSDLTKNVEHIKDIVNVQQSMAKASGLIQEVNPAELVQDALSALKASLKKHRVKFVQQIDDSVQSWHSDKHRILQVLINLIKNAKDALKEHHPDDAEILVQVRTDKESVIFEVTDNGIGIPSDKLDRIFQHGFTTKETGHGFGLHSSANAATEMGGQLTARSAGLGMGATFELRLPRIPDLEQACDNQQSESPTSLEEQEAPAYFAAVTTKGSGSMSESEPAIQD